MNAWLTWVEATAWRVADISWRASALALVVLAILSVGRRGIAPRWRFALWALVLARFAVPWTPAAPWSLFGLVPEANTQAAERVVAVIPDETTEANGFALRGTAMIANPMEHVPPTIERAASELPTAADLDRASHWSSLAAMAWMAGACGLVLREALLAVRLARRRRRWHNASDPQLLALHARCRAEAGLVRDVPLLVAAADAGPASVGAWRTSVVIPASLVGALPDEELHMVLLHELMHCRRRDVLVDRLAALVVGMHWFNPFAWFTLARLRAEREMACDAAVLDLVGERQRVGYGQTVLNVMERYVHPAPWPGLVGFGQRASVVRRIVDIAGYRRASRRSRALAAGVFALVVLGGFTSAMRGQSPQPAGTSQADEPTIKGRAATNPTEPNDESGTRTISLGGRCVDGETPVEGARLRLFRVSATTTSAEPLREARSNADGSFEFAALPTPPKTNDVPAWHYRIVATAERRSSAMRLNQPEFADELDLRIEMPPSASLSGRVTDDGGRPIAGAKVWVLSPLNEPIDGFNTDTTDAEGRYVIADLYPRKPGDSHALALESRDGFTVTRMAFHVSHPEFGRAMGQFSQVPSIVDVSLQRGATIVGVVFDEVTGKPAAGVTVCMQATSDPINAKAESWHTTTTDERGHYKFTSVSPGKFNIWADAEDCTCAAVDSLETTAGQQIAAPFLRLIEGGWIEGVVVSDGGAPMRHNGQGKPLQIGLYGPSRPKSGAAIQSTTVDDKGRFRLRAAPGANWPYICVETPDFQIVGPGEIEVIDGQTTGVVFRMLPRRGQEVLQPRQRPLLPPVELPLPVEAEREAAAAIRELGGWYKLDDDKHVIEVNMVYYDADGNRRDNEQRTDAALQHVPAFPRLKVLLLKEGQASDAELRHVRGLPQLERIYIWDAYTVTDEGAAHLAAVPKLAYIHLSNSQITDEAIRQWQALPRLYGLSLQGSRFTDKGLEHAAGIPSLRELFVGNGDTAITDEGLAPLAALTNLERLDLQGTDVTDAGLVHLESLGRLKSLWLSSTSVTPAGLAKLGEKLPDLDTSRAGVGDDRRNLLRDAALALVNAGPVPRLAYLAWQVRDDDEGDSQAVGPLWAADGSDVDPDVEVRLQKFVTGPPHNRRPEDRALEARPLILWFEDGSPLDVRPVTAFIVMPDGKRYASGTAVNSRIDGFRMSTLAPRTPFAWPERLALSIRCAAESPKLIKELHGIPDGVVDLGEGVTWQATAGADGRLETMLEQPRQSLEDRRAAYGVRVYAKGQRWPANVDGGYSTIVNDRERVVSPYKLDPDDIDLIRFTRQSYMSATIDDVPLRLDLLREAEAAARK